MHHIGTTLWVAAGCALLVSAGCAGRSSYLVLASGVTVKDRVALISTRVDFPGGTLFVHSDGSYRPDDSRDNHSAAHVFIEVDGQPVSNDSFIDWSGGRTPPAQHSFNVIGATALSHGPHKVALIAISSGRPVFVAADTNLSIMANPAPVVEVKLLSGDLPNSSLPGFDFGTKGLGTRPIPHSPILVSDRHDFNGVAVALASGLSSLGAYRRADPCAARRNRCGDAMWGLFVDASDGERTSTWTFNDLHDAAELRAPMFCQAYFRALTGPHQISLEASELPWADGENGVEYRVGQGTRLIVLSGLEIAGSGAASQPGPNDSTDVAEVGGPLHGQAIEIAQGKITIANGRKGVIFFAAKVRVFPRGQKHGSGFVTLFITIERSDGVVIAESPRGIQQIWPGRDSGRTIGASYLATDGNALPSGEYTVHAWGRYDGVYLEPNGSFSHIGMSKELPLIWFGRTQRN